MNERSTALAPPVCSMKGRSFGRRLGFASAGLRVVARRERSFRTQGSLALAAATLTLWVQPGWVWGAIIALSIALVLAFEMMNAALEYIADRLHPELHEEIGHAKDAAAGAVLVASLGAVAVGGLMLASVLFAA